MIEIDLDFGWRPEDEAWMNQRIAITAWSHQRGIARRWNGADDWNKRGKYARESTRTYWFPDEIALRMFMETFPELFPHT